MEPVINVIGAGLAGCEAALQAASRNVSVRLFEMKPYEKSPAHTSDSFSELVCSNSLKAESLENASGILKMEMKMLGSAVIESAYKNKVSAGGALAVDREGFSSDITNRIKANPNIEIICKRVDRIPDEGISVIATGPLTAGGLYNDIIGRTGSKNLFFFDAAAPVVFGNSINMDKAFLASRYGKGTADYINCPLDEERYNELVEFILAAKRKNPEDFERNMVFEGCMPVEVLASRGFDTLRFGPMKPVGLLDPVTGKRPYAVVQLRAENSKGTLWNLVGFQTNLKFGEQKRMLEMIPGLEKADVAKYGVMHRNSYINSPMLLDCKLNLRENSNIFFAGQLTGTEGYLESASTGIIAGIYAALMALGKNNAPELNENSMIGALIKHITNESISNFQPMNANFGILGDTDEFIKDKKKRREFLAKRSEKETGIFLDKINGVFVS